MNKKQKENIIMFVAIFIALWVVGMSIGIISAEEAITVTRTYIEGTEAGTAIVTLNYTVNTEMTSLAIKENISADWAITEQTSDPAAAMYKEVTHEWLYMVPPGVGESGTITYTVSGPPGDTDTVSGGYNIGEGYVNTPSTEVTLKGGDTEAPLTPSPTPTLTPEVTPTPTPTPSETETPSPSLSPTATPTVTPTATPTVTPTPSPSPAATPTPTPTPPGFEAVFAIAGLLAVACFALRRRK